MGFMRNRPGGTLRERRGNYITRRDWKRLSKPVSCTQMNLAGGHVERQGPALSKLFPVYVHAFINTHPDKAKGAPGLRYGMHKRGVRSM